MKHSVRYALGILIFYGVALNAVSYSYTIKVTPETVATYQKTIGPFLEKRKKQNGLLKTGIGGFFAKLSGVNVEEARAFLDRSFQDQQALNNALEKLANDPQCIAYMKKIVNEVPSSAIRRKNTKKLPELMRQHKYPGFNGSKTPWEDKNVTDTEFYNGAACSFMIYHLIESDGDARIKEPIKN